LVYSSERQGDAIFGLVNVADHAEHTPMSLNPGVDYVLCTKTTYMGEAGVTYGFVLGFPGCLLSISSKALAGAGFSHTRTTYALNGATPLAAIQSMLADPGVTAAQAEQTARELAAAVPGSRVVELARLAALRVKTGWFSRGIYYKQPGDRGWSGLPLADGSASAEAFAKFYASQLRE